MLVLIPLLVACALTAGGLLVWSWRLREQLAKLRCTVAEHQSSDTARVASLQTANEALRCKNRQLQTQCDQLHGEFVALSYSVSHDLRAPLRSLDGFSQALVEDYGPQLHGTAFDYLRRVRAAALHLNSLVDALLNLSRLVRQPFRPERLNLSDLARKTLQELSASGPARRVEWSVQPDLVVRGDRALLAALLQHLLGNAWKFSAGRPVAHISLRARTDNGGSVFEVRDDGVGFDPQYAGKLFGVFQRMHSADEFPGHGVGLAAAQRIVRRHGGTLQGTGEPDGGAVFSFTLPLDLAEEAAEAPGQLARPPAVAALVAAPSAESRKPSVV